MNEFKEIKVLDNGYVKLIDSMGNDASIANAPEYLTTKAPRKFLMIAP